MPDVFRAGPIRRVLVRLCLACIATGLHVDRLAARQQPTHNARRADAPPALELVRVPGEPASLTLALWHRPPRTDRGIGSGRTVLFIHGATFPSKLAAGFVLDGRSWMDDLADAGFDVWALDFPGYGASSRYPEMAQPATAHAPLGRSAVASRQIAHAIDFITQQQGVRRVSLVAHSWGTMPAALFATRAPERVHRLVLFGPIAPRQEEASDPAALPAYHVRTVEDQWQKFVRDVPRGEAPVVLRRHFDAWGAAYLASDTSAAERAAGGVRIPAGPIADIVAAWERGELPYDPAAVRSPVLIIRGEWDSLVTDADAAWLFDALENAPIKRDVKVSRATHLMHLETGRIQLYAEVRAFLAGGDAPDRAARRSEEVRP